MVELGTTGIDDENGVGGSYPDAGRYHVIINDVDESFEESNSIIVEFRVLAGTVPNQTKKTLKEYFSVSDKALPRLMRLGLASGFIPPNDPPKERNFEEAISRQLVVEIEDHTYEKNGETKKTRRISWMGMWSTPNPEVADVPKDAEAIRIISGVGGGSGGASPTDPPAAPPASSGGWEGLV